MVSEWSTLVNPGTRIPPAIQALTGITNAMVADAPAFDDLAPELHERLDGRMFVAHNARFDYGFLRHEFERVGLRFHAKRFARSSCRAGSIRSIAGTGWTA